MAYSKKLIDHYENPRNVGSMDKESKEVGTGLVGAPACGDVMKLDLKLDIDERIEDVKFKTYGCGSAIASSSLFVDMLIGKTIEEAKKIKHPTIKKTHNPNNDSLSDTKQNHEVSSVYPAWCITLKT